ncbi:MAG: hypothetical protein R2783_09325 [Gelidibacter sp.]
MKTIWILIQVKRGLIDEPVIFLSELEAEKRKEILMADFNRDYDEIEIFEKQVPKHLNN